MPKVAKRTFSLPAEQAAYIDAKVDGGAYASGSEVVRAGLRALQERDAAVERWLSEEVAPVYDAPPLKRSVEPSCSRPRRVATWSSSGTGLPNMPEPKRH
jgi:antitoxin ParD1/3/4